MKRGYVDTSTGQIHYNDVGSGEAILLIHQASRSGKIYARLADLLAPQYRVISVDIPGFGASDPLAPGFGVDDLVQAMVELLDGLGIDRVRVSGHHSGATIALELAVSHPERVAALFPTGLTLLSQDERPKTTEIYEKAGRHKTPVSNELSADGSHLMRFFQRAVSLLWQSKQSRGQEGILMLPLEDLGQEDLDFVNDFIVDGLRALPSGRATLLAVRAYDAEARLPLVTAPTLVIQSSGPLEPQMLQRAERAQKLVPGSRTATIENGDIHMIHTRAEELAQVILEFLAEVDS